MIIAIICIGLCCFFGINKSKINLTSQLGGPANGSSSMSDAQPHAGINQPSFYPPPQGMPPQGVNPQGTVAFENPVYVEMGK